MGTIKINDLDPSFKDRVAEQPGGAGIRACSGCKACTASCPVEAIDTRFDPRKIIRMVLLGMKKEVLGSNITWLCGACYGCHETCPQNVNFTEVMFAIKNLAVKEGCVPQGLAVQRTLLKQHGRLYQVTDFENGKRAKLGLPPSLNTRKTITYC